MFAGIVSAYKITQYDISNTQLPLHYWLSALDYRIVTNPILPGVLGHLARWDLRCLDLR